MSALNYHEMIKFFFCFNSIIYYECSMFIVALML